MSRFVILGINHIGIAPKDPLKAQWFFEKALSLGHLGDETVLDQKVETRMFEVGASSPDRPQPDSRLEILIPTPPGEGAVGKFLEKKGSGIHHLALSVDDVRAAIAHLTGLGVKMIDETPRKGAHHTEIAFVHPESTGGFLVELVQQGSRN